MVVDRGAQRVLVGVDGSEAALGAVVWATQEAARHDVSLTLLYVIDASRAVSPEVVAAEHQLAKTVLADAYAAAHSTGGPVTIEREVICGDPGTVLLQQSRSATLLCVGAPTATPHGPSDSLAAGVAMAAPCTVAVVPPRHCAAWERFGCLAIPVDPSNVDHDALQIALEEAQLHGFSLHVVVKDPDSAVDDLVHTWARRYSGVDTRVVHSDDLLMYVAEQHGSVHAVVVGADDHSEIAQLIELTRSRPAFYANPAVLVANSRHL